MQIEWLKCPSCGGTRKETGVGLRCMTCRGKGRLPLDPARYRDCEQCHGKGYLVWGDNPEDIEQTGDGAYRNIRDPQEPVNFALCWCCDGWGIVLRAGEAAKTTAGPPIRDLRKSFLMRRQSGDSCGARNCCSRSCCSCLARVACSAPSKRAATHHSHCSASAEVRWLHRQHQHSRSMRRLRSHGGSGGCSDGSRFGYPGASLFELTATES